MVADQVMQIINEIALKLGVAAEAVYPMLVKQADVFCGTYRIGLWIFGIVGVITLAFTTVWAARYISVHEYCDKVRTLSSIFAIIFWLVTFIIGLILLLYMGDYATAMYNPDMWAIQYVLNLMGVG